MRDHGWQLPFHPLQVAVIAVFSSLTFAFYVFLIPFLGSKVLEYHIVGIFSPLAIVVFVLYIRCAAINPADPGVRCSEAYQKPSTSTKTEPVEDVAFDSQRPETKSLGTVIYPESHKRPSGSASGARVNSETGNKIMKASCLSFQCFQSTFHCACGGKTRPRPVAQEDLLYCSLCRREISKYSKHCRACDKCVQGFDHHCRWINNCIGRRNYRSFFGLMITSLILLIMHWAIGIFVAVRCLMDREGFKGQIVSKLGSRFSLIPFIVVVAICTTVALLATFPLGQLFFFHIILIHKGMSTYDYIVAMRDVELRESADGDEESLQLSPTTSVATSISSYADGTQKKEILVQQGALVTSARHQPVTVTEVRGKAVTASQQAAKKKQPIRISPWKLAQLNAVEASRAATRARERSTTFIPIGTENSIVTETDSSLDSSTKSHAEIGPVSGSKKSQRQKEFPHSFFRDQFPLTKIYNNREIQASSIDHVHRNASSCNKAITPLQMEARSVFRPGLPVTNSRFSASPVRNDPSTRDVHSRIQLTTPARSLQDFFSEVYPSEPTNSWVPHSTSDGYEASGGESADDSELALKLSLNSNNLKSYATRRISDVPAKWNNKSEEKSNAINSKHEFNAMISSPSQFISPSRDSNFSSSAIISIPFNTKTRGIRGTSSGSVGHEDAFFSVDSRSTSMRSLQSPA